MTRLRTQTGLSLDEITESYGEKFKTYVMDQSQKHLEEHLLFLDNDRLVVTKKGKFLSDGIAADLFMLNLV